MLTIVRGPRRSYYVVTIPHSVSHIVWERQMVDLLDMDVVLFRGW